MSAHSTPEEFSERLRTALVQEPHPMSAEERRRLTWEDATERFLDAAELKTGERPTPIEEACDRLAWKAFNAFSGEILLSSVKERLNVWAKAPVQCHNLLSSVLQNPCSDAVACGGTLWAWHIGHSS